jgi:small-conductance mechanosensitive channel
MSRVFRSIESFELPTLVEWQTVVTAIVIFVLGLLILRIAVRLFVRIVLKGVRERSKAMIRKALIYVGVLLLLVVTLRTAGVQIAALLGAAGVLGIAIGIASQASLSNIISGLFLVSERFFEIGDVVRVSGHVGVIHAIDLLSIKIKTFDNVLVRVPNQQIIETDFVNITRFPIRRLDFSFTFRFDARISDVFDALREACRRDRNALTEPEPFLMYTGHTGDGWTVKLGVWFERSQYVAVQNGIASEVQSVLSERGIQIVGSYVRVAYDADTAFDSQNTPL